MPGQREIPDRKPVHQVEGGNTLIRGDEKHLDKQVDDRPCWEEQIDEELFLERSSRAAIIGTRVSGCQGR